jgi:hypothetical protein
MLKIDWSEGELSKRTNFSHLEFWNEVTGSNWKRKDFRKVVILFFVQAVQLWNSASYSNPLCYATLYSIAVTPFWFYESYRLQSLNFIDNLLDQKWYNGLFFPLQYSFISKRSVLIYHAFESKHRLVLRTFHPNSRILIFCMKFFNNFRINIFSACMHAFLIQY